MGQPEMGPPKTNVPEERTYRCQLLGTGASAPTKVLGDGVSVTRTALGVYKLTFVGFNPFALVGFTYGYGATTPGDVKGQTVTRNVVVITAGVAAIEVSLWSSGFAADDLQTTESLDLSFTFTEL